MFNILPIYNPSQKQKLSVLLDDALPSMVELQKKEIYMNTKTLLIVALLAVIAGGAWWYYQQQQDTVSINIGDKEISATVSE
jgi:hypothetical protein